jgi:hypothetical protein
MSGFISAGLAAFGLVIVPVVASAQTAARPAVRNYAAELACAPDAVFVVPTQTLRIAGGTDAARTLFSIGDAVIILGGTSQGVKPGQEYLIRRRVDDRFIVPVAGGLQPVSIHTAGWLRIVDAQTDVAYATIMHTCDSIEPGDFLAPMALPTVPAAAALTEPDYGSPGHLILGDERRQMGGAGSLMVIDRGSDHGVRAGQRMTVFRRTIGGAGPVFAVADATALTVNPETTVVRIDTSRDAVYVGDLIALHR